MNSNQQFRKREKQTNNQAPIFVGMKKMSYMTLIAMFFLSGTCNPQETNMTHEHTNALIHETSPYLLQHAHNPVDWHPWGDEAFEIAKEEDKLLLISIGYSACHWCHVMEHECFEDSTTAAYMNEHFVCIKVDREERPDVDQVYMTAVQLMTRRGGWPLNCFALPDGRPIYGGTYFPKNQWMTVMKDLVEKKASDYDGMVEYAERLTQGVQSSEMVIKVEDPLALDTQALSSMVEEWKKLWDTQLGGPNRAPKFPLPNNYSFLLHYGHLKGNAACLEYATTSMNRMARGGIYDQIGGGFARYSTDMNWKVPHFEKMLYDNAQLIKLYSEAYQLNANEEYERVIRQSIDFVERELKSPSGMLYSALDADSEGEEGKFYIWDAETVERIAGTDWNWLKAYYNISAAGLWEGHYILLREGSNAAFAREWEMTEQELLSKVDLINEKLLKERSKRVRPGLDDKSLTSWNALMISGYVAAYRALGEEKYKEEALKLASLIWEKQHQDSGALWRNFKDGKSSINGYLEDFSFLIEGYLDMYQVTFDEGWISKAQNLSDYAIEHYLDDESGMFWFTSDLDPPLIARKLEVSDNVIPASNSSMAKSLFLLGTLTDRSEYKELSEQMLHNIAPSMNYGPSFSNWGMLYLWMSEPFYEIAITGENSEELHRQMGRKYTPNAVLLGAEKNSALPLLEGKFLGAPTIFVCENKTCQLPVSHVEEALEQMK